MKDIKKILGTTLSASLATGIVGSVGTIAGAATIDEIYKAAYDATINALANKDQDSINAARAAIDKLPSEFQAFKGEFSKQVDSVQHPILVKIVDAINNSDKTGKQVDINAARMTMPAGLPEVWKNSYSVGIDKVQQKLIEKAVSAAATAINSGKQADIDAAKALLDEIALVEKNEGVKGWIDTYSKEFTNSIKLSVSTIDVVSNNTVKVNFLKEIDASTVSTKVFTAYKADDKSNLGIASVKVLEDKKSVEVRFSEDVTENTAYNLEVKDIKDLSGATMTPGALSFEYVKAEVASVSITKTKITVAEDLKKSVVVKDTLGRDVTSNSTITFESSNTGVINSDGFSKAQGDVVVTAVVKDSDGNVVLRGEKTVITVKDAVATDYQGYSVYTLKSGAGEDDKTRLSNTYSDFNVAVDTKLNDLKDIENDKVIQNKIAFFFKDQYGKEVRASETMTIEVLENMTPSIATLGNDRVITTVKEGTAYFKVKVADVTKVISVNVLPEAKPTALTLDKTNVVMADDVAQTQKITLSLKDQYGKFYNDGELKYQIKNASGQFVSLSDEEVAKYVTLTTSASFTKGETEVGIAITPPPAGEDVKLGTNTFRITYERKVDNTIVDTIVKDFSVTVKEAGTIANYETGTISSLDLYDDPLTPAPLDETRDTFNIYGLDSNGSRVSKVTGLDQNAADGIGAGKVNIKITDSKGADATAKFTVSEAQAGGNGTGEYTIIAGLLDVDGKLTHTPDNRAAAPETGDYTVAVKVGDTTVKTYTLTVKDSAITAKTIDFRATNILAATFTTSNIKTLVNVSDQFGAGITLHADDKVEADAASVKTNIKYEADGVTEKSYDLVISKVKVTFDNTANPNKKDATITLPTPVVISVVK